ncbi:MAG: hypothetical protein AB7Y46_02655 [Armatimonadota bacterium]
MDERREQVLSWGALVLVLALLAGEVALLTTHLCVPLARALERVADERYAESPQPPGSRPEGAIEPLAAARVPSPWRWAAYGITAAAAALVLIAFHRRIVGTTEPGRWLWVLLMGGLVVIWGLLTAWLMTRQASMFDRFIQQPGPLGPQP